MANKLSELNLSEEEVQRLTKAFKKEEFKKLFAEYAEEISNPENRKRYEAEIAQLEAERGMDIKFVQPEPGHVIKTTVNGEIKAFINICKNDHIEKPSANKQKTQDGRYGLQWSIPHSFAPPREDTDKSGNKCRVFDVVFHPDTYRMGETNVRFRKMLHDTAFDGIERQFDVSIDRKNMKFPKMKFKGIPSATVIRSKSGEKSNGIDKNDIMNNFPYPYDEKTTEEKSREMEKKFEEKNNENKSSNGNATKENKADPYTTPKYSIKHRSEIELDQFRNAPDARPSTRPKELVVEIDLPLLKSAAPVDLDIFERRLFLKSEEPAKYKLDLCLPYPVDENNGSAKFDKSKKKLIVTLPVLADETVQNFFEEIQNVGQISEGGADGQSSLNEQGKPLIEVLSSSENSGALESTPSEITASLRDNQEVMNDDNERNKTITDKDIWTPHDNCPEKQNIRYTMPDFDYDQDVGTVSLVMHVKNIEIDSVVKIFSPDDQKQIRIRFVSMGSGCFPVHYSILLKFEEGCNIVPEDCTVDVSAENLVLVLAKAKLSWSWWDKFTVGVDENNLQEKYFITEKTLKAELDELGGAPIVPAEQVNSPELRVTEMNSDHVTVEIKDKEDSAGSDQASPESEIEIIHERVPPKLHSILKQRSRTTSESSDEVFSSSFSRENSITTSESPISEGDEEHASGRKKSVSFSEQVDHTSYKSNSTVSTLHNTLKNRRKKARQREEKKSKGKGGRRRRTSSGGSYSSDDLSSSGKPEEFQLGDADLDPHTKVTKKGTGDVRRGSPVDDVKSAHSPPETKSRGKSKQIVAQEEAAATDTNVLENKKGLRENCKRVQKGNAPRKPSDVTQIGSEPPVKPDGNSITNGHDASAKETDIIDEKDVFRDPKLNHGGNNAPCVNVSSDENSSDKKSRNRKRKNKNKQVWVISGGSEDEDDKSEENKVANVAEDEEQKVAKADTKLKWEESKHQADSNEHKTQCAFQFSNSLMYDLDED